MESVVATVSGYHGSERFNLIKLISHAGAHYVGTLSRSTTHLVCWKFEGRKYQLAKNLKTIIVNHRWVEECIKQGKRVPEHPYILQCGQEVGPLLLEVPHVPKMGVSTKNPKVLSDKSNACDGSEKRSGYMGLGSSSHSVWTHSRLLNENLIPDTTKVSKSSRKLKRRLVKKTSKQELQSNSRCCFDEPPLSGFPRIEVVKISIRFVLFCFHVAFIERVLKLFVEMEHPFSDLKFYSCFDNTGQLSPISKLHEESSSESSMDLIRDKRKISNDNGRVKPETSRKGRRLVRKNRVQNTLQLANSDSDQDCYLVRVHNPSDNDVMILSNNLDGIREENRLESGRTSDDGSYNQRAATNEGLEDAEDGNHNDLCTSVDLNVQSDDALHGLENTSQNGCCNVENSKEEIRKGAEIEHETKFPSTELSCVICWTDFSPIRGVLPCGHRFCYSCIQNWADTMASKRKVSTCPLCKARFVSITKFEDAATLDQKIYSQTIPCGPSTMDMFILGDEEMHNISPQSSSAPVCTACRFREPEDLLISCYLCQTQCIHSYCLDPPLLPWTCIHCKDLQMLFRNR
ncbi:hypothetical protein FEM48_Zijuj04G0065200 [Ziziphus jujuba var. spinosa]|uniref:RING-type E3 ubiquitin transferase BRCA1 n=1 Tax=Ziziphus jujuba var. spinosa TaxID=714518 RepID=A0A978VIC1_ZIZJJ|nr:hypothetical protein FEM48_Zijuj04G0065200 [Ziziphus jujuba var. spinosa]